MTGPGLRAVVFDFDGLIVDTESSEFHSVGLLFAEHGVVLQRTEWQRVIGTADHPHWTLMLEEALGRPLDDRDALIVRHRDRHTATVAAERVRPGVVELLDEAAGAGVAAAVASSSSRTWVCGHLDRLGLTPRFDTVVTSDDLGGDRSRTKPAPDLFLLAAERLGVPPGACAVLEDSPHGVVAARAAGMAVVAVPGPMTSGMAFPGAHRTVGSLTEIALTDLRRLVSEARA
ncbi:MAG TPA: HAD-IA family hydrolase [Acidimicrobiales bacterium]